MRTFVELVQVGGRRVIVDTAAIVTVDYPHTKTTMSSTESPISLMVRGAGVVRVVAIEPAMLLGKMAMAIAKADELRGEENAPPLVVSGIEDESAAE